MRSLINHKLRLGFDIQSAGLERNRGKHDVRIRFEYNKLPQTKSLYQYEIQWEDGYKRHVYEVLKPDPASKQDH